MLCNDFDVAEATLPSPLAEIYRQQENALIARMKSVQATKKPELIGAELERAIREELAFQTPAGLRVVSGFVIHPDGQRSSHFDAIVCDTRYPLLANVAGNALVPLHAVVVVIEVKTTLNSKSLAEVDKTSREVESLTTILRHDLEERRESIIAHIPKFAEEGGWTTEQIDAAYLHASDLAADASEVRLFAIAMRSTLNDETIAMKLWKPFMYDIMVLRAKSGAKTQPVPIRINRFGPKSLSRHFFKEMEPSQVCIRRTQYCYGYFVQSVIYAANEVLSGRSYSSIDISYHIDHYLELLIDRDPERVRKRLQQENQGNSQPSPLTTG